MNKLAEEYFEKIDPDKLNESTIALLALASALRELAEAVRERPADVHHHTHIPKPDPWIPPRPGRGWERGPRRTSG